MNVLAARDAYRLWSANYETETAVSFAENQLVDPMMPPLKGLRLLDAGCGTGRRLRGAETALAVGVDASAEMVTAGRGGPFAVADIRSLPFAAGAFDAIWCRLVIGHLPELGSAYREFGRVCRSDGWLLLTDFHPDAAGAGGRRTFRDAHGDVHEVEHYVHPHAAHIAAAEEAGFDVIERRDGVIGPPLRPFFEQAGRMDIYQRQIGQKIVSAWLFRRR
jgi:malonyl-CoA O-methyltransferase